MKRIFIVILLFIGFGCSKTITSPAPFAGYIFTQAGDTVRFHALQFENDVQYFWIFGDGSMVNSNVDAEHIYSMPGTYLSGLLVQAKGSEALVSQSILIK